MGMEDEVDWNAMVAANKSRVKGITGMPIVVLDRPQVGRVKVASETGKEGPKWNASIVAGRVTGRASTGKSAPIQKNPDLARLNTEIS